ncbi:hypothetical protein [Actinoplanes lobatus]|uniref:Uncharacterized protein n=1 Tax=Actinoplanes lobatus TaxID=113568 RepID=A0A7W7HN33_9ACTN|nr:hypothetical protein [Actinoplanes lobatus]MBB4753535.1 hypothetical protein [Actinoplanes lobatus]
MHVRVLIDPSQLTPPIETRTWKNPGVAALTRVVPWFEDPLNFLAGPHEMECQSGSLDRLAADDETARPFRLARGPADLPWLDIGNAFFIAVCHYAGDDTTIALTIEPTSPTPETWAATSGPSPARTAGARSPTRFSGFAVALGLDPTRSFQRHLGRVDDGTGKVVERQLTDS